MNLPVEVGVEVKLGDTRALSPTSNYAIPHRRHARFCHICGCAAERSYPPGVTGSASARAPPGPRGRSMAGGSPSSGYSLTGQSPALFLT